MFTTLHGTTKQTLEKVGNTVTLWLIEGNGIRRREWNGNRNENDKKICLVYIMNWKRTFSSLHDKIFIPLKNLEWLLPSFTE